MKHFKLYADANEPSLHEFMEDGIVIYSSLTQYSNALDAILLIEFDSLTAVKYELLVEDDCPIISDDSVTPSQVIVYLP